MTTGGERAGDAPYHDEHVLLEDDRVRLEIEAGPDACPRIVSFGPAGPASRSPALPLVDVVVAGTGRAWSGARCVESVVGARLTLAGVERTTHGDVQDLVVTLADAELGLRVEVSYRLLVGQGALTSSARVVNGSDEVVVVESLTSLLVPGIEGISGDLGAVELRVAENTWLSEGRWRSVRLRDVLPDLGRDAHEHDSRGWFGLTASGSWSSGAYLPMGAAVGADGTAFAWQVEHNGAWHWQVGEYSARSTAQECAPPTRTGAYLAVLGPTRRDHDWCARLAPGESFETVPATVVVSRGGLRGAIAALTARRRASRRPHRDHERLPVVFNDYMNTLMGEPTTARLLPLVDAAAEVGAECFCIDAGWFAALGEPWWQSVGRWMPSTDRFPGGIGEVLGHIRARNLVPGLWLEPEVVGVRSPLADELPDGAFFTRDGIRVVEQDRYLLDLRHPAAVRHLDAVVDNLVDNLGVGYLKLDYNVDAGVGSDAGGEHAGTGLLGHNRALLAWLDSILDRHPGLTLESCSSGGMRTDAAMLGRCQLHSTSDQQDFRRYPPIAAAALAAVPYEQAANWSYPQPDFDDDEIAFALVTGLVGRMYLSGHLDEMSPGQRALVAEAVSLHKELRSELSRAVPFWPLDLPGWEDPWVAVGLCSERLAVLGLWRRSVRGAVSDTRVELSVPEEVARLGAPEVLFPSRTSARIAWDERTCRIGVHLLGAPSACLVGFGHRGYASRHGGGC